MLGPYIKSRVAETPKCQQMQTSSQWRHIYNKEKQFENSFSYMSQNVNKICIFWAIWGALRGCSIIRVGLSCFPAIITPISMYMSNMEAI